MQIFILLSFLFLSQNTYANTNRMCNKKDVQVMSEKVKAHSGNDKNQHCAISCMMSVKCGTSFALLAGYFKELEDIFTPGDADWEDIKADKTGIQIYRSKRARNDRECFEQCDNYYHP